MREPASNKLHASNPAMALLLSTSVVIGERALMRSVRRALMRVLRVILLAAVLVIAGCSRAPVVTIINQSSVTLSNVVVSGSGFSERIASIPARGEHRLTVHPSGESALRVTFDAGTQHVDSGEQGYFESGGGYRIGVIVSTNLSVSVSPELPPY